jgi:hypothetical protein
LNFKESPGKLDKTTSAHSTVLDSASQGWDLRICFSYKFLEDANAVGTGTALSESLY